MVKLIVKTGAQLCEYTTKLHTSEGCIICYVSYIAINILTYKMISPLACGSASSLGQLFLCPECPPQMHCEGSWCKGLCHPPTPSSLPLLVVAHLPQRQSGPMELHLKLLCYKGPLTAHLPAIPMSMLRVVRNMTGSEQQRLQVKGGQLWKATL